MSRIKKALRKWVYGEEIEDPCLDQIGKMLPLYEHPRYGINGMKTLPEIYEDLQIRVQFTHDGRIASTELIKKQEDRLMKIERLSTSDMIFLMRNWIQNLPISPKRFLAPVDDGYIAVDNTTNECHMGYFKTETEAELWLSDYQEWLVEYQDKDDHTPEALPKEQTIIWNNKEYGLISLKPGELKLGRRPLE